MKLNTQITFTILAFLGVIYTSSSFATNEKKNEKTRPPVIADAIDIKLDFTYSNFTLPVRVFEFNSPDCPTGRWQILRNRKLLPFGSEISSKPVKIRKGSQKCIAYSVENKSDKDIYFYVAPHETIPSENSLGNKLFCICNGRVYRVPPNSTWIRVGQLNIEKNSFGNELTFRHRIIGLTPEKLKQSIENLKYSGGVN